MRTISLRSFSREAPGLEEAVLVTHESSVIGRFIPLALDTPQLRDVGPGQVDARVDVSSGPSFGYSRPAPKPTRKKA